MCRQIIKLNPKKLLLIDISEYSLYNIHAELIEIKNKLNFEHEFELIPFLASTQDEYHIKQIMNKFKPNSIYHAAAYKHVPLV